MCGEDRNIYALDRAAAVLGPNYVFPKFLISQSHCIHAERTQRRRRIEELRQNLDIGPLVCGYTS